MYDSDSDSDSDKLVSVKINRKKLIKFQEWCGKNEINYLVVIEKLMDSCLENNPIIIDTIINKKDNVNLEEKVNFIISESLQHLMARIEKLESQWEIKNNYTHQNKSNAQPLLSNLPQEDISKRVYLPRQQIWQKLKKTDYIKYFGYDSFLKAKGDQLIEYGIFFDEHKKRFYIIDNEE
ncbi:hypothetical protein [Geminocystis sp. GBBB08]|uniref:hypothetical protein n=1 Tax=Geminocystis sp. GBBB08 TaxID=2604140 RepID=UPI0027E2F2D8|nr:hypothetical protein [Geminocystis sp. GBBB08]MBL1209695.1 hypothetical protein [Geminocystis sp. GBBB08]